MSTTKKLTQAEAVKFLSELDGIDYLLTRGINGMVLSHTRPDGFAAEFPIIDFSMYFYRRTGLDCE